MMKISIYWLISFILIILSVLSFILTGLKVTPGVLLLEIFFCMILLFTANMSSGITYGLIHKIKIISLIGFTILNVCCIFILIYYSILLIFILF